MAISNILNVFHSDPATREIELKKIASNATTDFGITICTQHPLHPLDHNIFHACVTQHALNRLKAIRDGIKTLTSENPTLKSALNATTKKGETPLYLVSKSYSTKAYDIAQILLDLGADPTIPHSLNGSTPDQRCNKSYSTYVMKSPLFTLLNNAKNEKEGLLGSLRDGNFQKAHEHLKNGTAVDQLDPEGNNVLLLAIKVGARDSTKEERVLAISKLLWNKVDVNHKNNQGETALFLAVRGGLLKMVEFLLFTAKVNTSLVGNGGATVLHIAAEGRSEVVEILLNSSAREQILVKDTSGRIPLHLVKEPEVCELLCRADPTSINMEDNAKLKPVRYYAKQSRYKELCAVLDSYDPDKKIKDIPKGSATFVKETLQEINKQVDVTVALTTVANVGLNAATGAGSKIATAAVTAGTAYLNNKYFSTEPTTDKDKETDKEKTSGDTID